MHISGNTVQAAPAGAPSATLPDFTASMISSSLPRSVPPWKTTLSVPLERFVTSSARYLKAMAPDSGGAMMWARSSLRAPGLGWAGAGGPAASSTRARATATDATLRCARLMKASCRRGEGRAIVRRCQARRPLLPSARREPAPPRSARAPPRGHHRAHARGDGRHAGRRLPALRDDVGVGALRPALRALLLGGGDRRVLAGLAHLHRRRRRHPARHPLRRPHRDRALPAGPAPGDRHRPLRPAHRLRRAADRLRLASRRAQQPVVLAGARPQPALALPVGGGRRRPHGDLQPLGSRGLGAGAGAGPLVMLIGSVAVTFIVLTLLSLPIVFALGLAGFTGLLIGNFSLTKLPSALVAGSQSWVLLAIPTFVFAGSLMERCGMSYALVDLARALVGWVRGGLGLSVVLAEYFFSGISGSTIADVSAIGSMMTPPMLRAGYKPEHAVSLVASATAMGILVPPAIFMIVLAQITDTSVVGIFLGGFIPAAVTAACLMTVIFIQAHRLGWPKDVRPTWPRFVKAGRASLVPLVVPIVIVLGFFFGVFTATEAGALVAAYAMAAALLYYRNVTWREMWTLLHETALLTAAVIFLLAVASIYQFLMGMLGVPLLIGELLRPLHPTPWLFLLAVSALVMLFGMVLEGLPAAVVLIPVVFPISKQIGIHPVHFATVLTAAVGIGLFLPPIGVGLLMALRFADVSVGRHFRVYWPYLLSLFVGLLLLILLPELTLFLPRRAGLIR